MLRAATPPPFFSDLFHFIHSIDFSLWDISTFFSFFIITAKRRSVLCLWVFSVYLSSYSSHYSFFKASEGWFIISFVNFAFAFRYFRVFSCHSFRFFLHQLFSANQKKKKTKIDFALSYQMYFNIIAKAFNISKRLLTSLRKLSTLPSKLFAPQWAFNITSKALTLSQEEEFERRVDLKRFDLGTFITFLRV